MRCELDEEINKIATINCNDSERKEILCGL